MKKSDAIKQLKYWLFGASVNPEHQKEAKALLDKLESMGMLPPFSVEVYQKQFGFVVSNRGHKWEPET